MTLVDNARSRWAGMGPRRRRRFLMLAAGGVGFLMLSSVVGSMLSAAVLAVGAAALVGALLLAARMAGLGRDNRAVSWLLERAWRDADDVLAKAIADMDNLPLRTSAGPLAPRHLTLGVHRETFEALTATCELQLLCQALTSAYGDVISRLGAEVSSGPHTIAVLLRVDPTVGRGQWKFTTAHPAANNRAPASPLLDATVDVSGPTRDLSASPMAAPQERTRKLPADAETADAHPQPRMVNPGAAVSSSTTISLLTGSHQMTGTTSPCTVGRGRGADLQLPDVPSISRAHAVLTRHGPIWWIECTGRNGLLINGTPIGRRHRLRDGDVVQWGTTRSATASRVRIDT